MKPGHKYHVNPPRKRAKNPVPFAAVVANSPGSRRPAKKRNPIPRGKPGMWVIKKPSRNPSPMKKSHRRKAAKRRNPPKLQHVLLLNSAKTKRRRGKRRTHAVNPFSLNSTMKTKRRRGARRRHHAKNPKSSGGYRRNSHRRKSSHRRRRNGGMMMRRRNPGDIQGFAKELFGADMLSVAGGVVIAGVGTTLIMNRLITADPTTGQRAFDLPGVDYSMLNNAATAGQFYTKNAWVLAGYKLIIGGTAGFLLRHQSPRLARGIMIGTVAMTVSDVLKNTGVLTASGNLAALARGTGRQFRPGTGYLPGTSTQFTGPAQRFLTANNVPRPRGMGATVGPMTMSTMERNSEGAFRGAN